MGRTRRWRWALCAVGAVLAGGLTPPVAGAEPAAADPGAIVSVEPLPPELSVSGAAVAQRLTYRTEWRSGAPAVGTGVLFVPPGPAPEGGRPVISYAHGTVGIGDDCAPSRNPRADVERAYLEHWLAQGYAVVAADYPGLGTDGVHTYLDGQSAANSVVDIVRAGRAAEPSLSPRWVVVGQSQGGHAALHTAHRASLRAPELDFRGTVTTGAPSNLERLFPFGGPGFPDPGFEGLVAFSSYIFAGLRAAHPDLDVNSYLTPPGGSSSMRPNDSATTSSTRSPATSGSATSRRGPCPKAPFPPCSPTTSASRPAGTTAPCSSPRASTTRWSPRRCRPGSQPTCWRRVPTSTIGCTSPATTRS